MASAPSRVSSAMLIAGAWGGVWIGPRDSDEPAPRVKIAEAATPVDIVSIHGESVPRETRAAPTPKAPTVIADASVRGDSDDHWIAVLALVIGTLALLTGIAALVSGRSRRRGAA